MNRLIHVSGFALKFKRLEKNGCFHLDYNEYPAFLSCFEEALSFSIKEDLRKNSNCIFVHAKDLDMDAIRQIPDNDYEFVKNFADSLGRFIKPEYQSHQSCLNEAKRYEEIVKVPVYIKSENGCFTFEHF